MNSKTFCLLLALGITAMCGCATYEPPLVHVSISSLDSLKTAYVVLSAQQDAEIGRDIQDALAKHGVQVQAGPLANKPKDVSFYVEYEDHWRWDMAMYLLSLDIHFKDNSSGDVIASGVFRALEGIHHGYADRREETFAIIDSIYKSK